MGSVATGTFGTVPGLMLLPFLTDTLGIAALTAGLIVFLPKAWDVVLNPIAGRISDRTDDPRGPRRPWLLRAGLPLAVAFALIFAGPDLGSSAVDVAWVLLCFLAAATAYAFFQVPYVAMPAEITTSYDERTRLMTWRVAILAFTIMLAGATAPVIRDAVGGRDGYRVMGVVMSLVILVGVVSAWWGTRRAPIGAVSAGAGAAYRDRLLALPGFLTGESDPAPADVAAGFALTEFFLRRHVFEPRGEDLPEERRRLAAAAMAADLPARF